MHNIEKFNQLLKEFQKIYNKDEMKKSQTFLEIAKMPHQEVVISNILAFYLDVNEEHELQDLVLKALIKASNISIKKDILDVTVEREYITEKRNFIDIVLYNDEFAIGIENKIYSLVYNDLEDYASTIRNINKNAYNIILSLKDESNIAKANNFINVTYQKLFDEINKMLDIKFDSNNKWHIYLKDFIQNVENLYGKGKSIMNTEMLEWTSRNKEEINTLYGFFMALKNELNDKTNMLQTILNERIKEFDFIDYTWIWNKNGIQDKNFRLYTICVIEMKKYKIAIDNYLDSSGWNIELSFRGKTGYDGLKQNVIRKLESSQINYECYDKNHIRIFKFDYNEQYENITNSNIKILNLLKEIIT